MRRILPFLIVALALGCGSSDSEGQGLGGRPNSGVIGGNGTTRPECGALGQGCMGQPLDAPLALGSTLEVAIDYQLVIFGQQVGQTTLLVKSACREQSYTVEIRSAP